MTIARGVALFAFGTLLLSACDDSPSEPSTPSAIAVSGGNAITGRIGTTATVSVSVTTSNGRTLASTPVTFAVSSGGGTITPTSTSTDANGQATAVWTFGNTLGAQSLTVTAGTITQTINATVSAGLPASIAVSAGNGQTAAAGTVVSTPPAVIVRDASNNPVAGVTVQFTSLPSGTVVPTTVQTDASGIARVTSWTLGNQAGTYTLQATALDANIRTGNPVLITATATAGAAARITPSTSLPTTGTVGSALSGTALPSVTVTDANGNPVSGASVTFAVTSGGGTLTGATATTNAQGVATVGGYTLGQTAGPNTLTATVQGIGAVNLSITGTAGTAAQTQIVSGNNQSVRAGQALAAGPSVRVVDRFGNPVAGATVQFVATGGGASLLGATQTTNAAGVATVGGVTLGTTPGTNTIVARVAGAADVTFTATGLAGAPAQLIRVSGDSQTVVAFRSATQPIVVRVLDADGFAVRNASVTFALSGTNSGTLSATTVQTDSLGRASTTFTANGVLGQQTVTATVGSLTPIQFVVTTSQNVVASITAVTPLTQSATAGTPVAFAPTVLVRDALGNPVAGITVQFGVYTGSGSVQNSIATSDVNGIATSGSWTISSTPGENLLAAIANVPSNVPGATLQFSATGIVPPSSATLTQVTGVTPSTAPAGSTVAAAVQVRDGNGNPVAGLTVQFQVTAGGGNIGGQTLVTAVTDASGIARVNNWTLGTTGATLNSLSAAVLGSGLVVGIVVTTQ